MRTWVVSAVVAVLLMSQVPSAAESTPDFALVYETTFDGPTLPDGWLTYDGQRVRRSNLEIANGIATLSVKPYGDGEWRGAAMIFTTPFTSGLFVARVRVDPAHFTKALGMLWPIGSWPPEIDFMEIGESDWTRQRNTLTAHYDPDDKMIHRSYYADMTEWHTISVGWKPDSIVFRLDGKIMPNTWGDLNSKIDNPGIVEPMTFRLVYWPTHKADGMAWPDKVSKMEVEWVKIYA